MNKNIRLIAIINAIIMVVWLVIVNAILNIFTLGFYAVMGFIWAIIAFALTEVSVIQWNLRRNPDLTEINFLPYLLTEAMPASISGKISAPTGKRSIKTASKNNKNFFIGFSCFFSAEPNSLMVVKKTLPPQTTLLHYLSS